MNASRGLVALWALHSGSLARYTNNEFGGRGINGCNGDFSRQVEQGYGKDSFLGQPFGQLKFVIHLKYAFNDNVGERLLLWS